MNISRSTRLLILFLVLVVMAGVLVAWGPIIQPQGYHRFGAARLWLVLSNVPMIFVGIWGLIRSMVVRTTLERVLWICFSVGLILTGIGSMVYHNHPNDQTLFWDRLPMGFTFMALFAAILIERVGGGIWLSLFLLVLGVLSVGVWRWTGDLRFFVLVQFYPAIAIPLVLWLYRATYTLSRLLVYGWLWYALSKLAELLDWQTGLGGHGVKHVLVAVATYCIVRYVQRRHAI